MANGYCTRCWRIWKDGSINYMYGGNYVPYNATFGGNGQAVLMGKYSDVRVE